MPQSETPLNPKQTRFVAEFLVDLNATQAAIRTGYSARTASVQGARLLANAKFAAAVAAGQSKALSKIELTAERVLEELGRLAFVDPRKFFDEQGNLKSVATLDTETAAALEEFVLLKENLVAGDGKRDTVYRVKWADKLRALELLAKRFGLVKEKVEVTFAGELAERLARARQRVAKKDG
jgi:phage terminase small subunit